MELIIKQKRPHMPRRVAKATSYSQVGRMTTIGEIPKSYLNPPKNAGCDIASGENEGFGTSSKYLQPSFQLL